MSISLYLYMNITLHFYLIHFIYLYISIFLYNSIRISLYFLRFSYSSLYGFLTVHSTIFSTVYSPLRFCFATVPSLLQLPPLRSALRLSIRPTRRLALYGFLLLSLYVLLFSFHTHYKSLMYSEYYLLLYLYSCSFLRFFLPRFFLHIFYSV